MKMTVSRASLVVIAMTFTACATGNRGAEQMQAKTIEEALKEHTAELMSLPGVVGTAQGLCDDRPCIKVYVIKKDAVLLRRISGNIEGYPVVVEESGEFRTLPDNQK